jgi:hypothetical protein
MGMVGSLRSLTREEVKRLEREPAFADELSEDTDTVEALSFGKSFHAVHFGLTGRADYEPCGPLGNAVLGLEGTMVGIEETWGYGLPHLLTPEQVAAVDQALSTELFKSRLLGPEEDLGGVYRWEGTSLEQREEVFHEVEEMLDELREFYREAASDGLAVIAFIA